MSPKESAHMSISRNGVARPPRQTQRRRGSLEVTQGAEMGENPLYRGFSRVVWWSASVSNWPRIDR
jgi:hypothetical protein